MPHPEAKRSRSIVLTILASILVIGGVATAALTKLPARFSLGESASAPIADDPHDGHDHSGHDHAGHDDSGESSRDHGDPGHGLDGHSDQDAIELSPQARENLGLRVRRVSLESFTEYIEVPGLVTDWPGRTHVIVTSPLTGVINAIHISQGEMIDSGDPLFSLRLTHQDLVKTQEQFLTQLGQLDVEEKEISRLTSIANSGAVAGKTLISRQYEHDKLLASVRAARQSMLLHGLTQEQIESIERTRELVREITVYAPQFHADESLHHDALHDQTTADDQTPSQASATQFTSHPPPVDEHSLHVDAELLVTLLEVNRGQSVTAGENLAQLSDYRNLLIEGHAFQRDSAALRDAAKSQSALQAILDASGDKPEIIDDLKVVNIGNEVGRESRTLPFYVGLNNKIERSESRDGQRFVSWRYKPGQRLKLRLPLKTYDNVIVVPKVAVGKEGLENYVFVDRGDHLDRVPVQLVAKGPINVAVAYDGQLKSRHKIAINSAHQLLMALRNQAGGGVDPHAGHSH